MPGAIAVERSGNKKIGYIHATHVSQASCPPTCSLRGHGCYAENFPQALTTLRLNKSGTNDPAALAIEEAEAILKLSGKYKLRGHVVGDCTTPEAASIVGQAYVDFEKRTGKKSWTYTHAWRDVPVEAWRGANVIASCETVEEVKEAQALGYATALIVPEFLTDRVYPDNGINIVPCPEQLGRANCSTCNICQSTKMLRERNLTVGFVPHGAKKNQVLRGAYD